LPTVSTGNYTIGMVDLYFEATVAHASLLATDSTVETGKGGAFRTDARSLGNIVGLELNPDITYVDHFVADRGTRKKDKTTTSMVSLTIPFTFDEMNYNNLQRYFVGSSLSNTTIAPFEKALFTGCAQMVFRTDVGKGMTYFIPKCQIRPNGSLAISGESWWTGPCVLEILYYNTDHWASKPYGLVLASDI